MRNKLLLLIALLLFPALVFAQTLQFEKPVRLKTNDGEPINAEGLFAIPTLHDIDADGDLDLIVGDKSCRFLVFVNSGSNARPSYEQPYKLQVGGKDAFVNVS